MGMIFLFLIETWVLDKIYFYDSFLTIKNCLKLLKIVVHRNDVFIFDWELKICLKAQENILLIGWLLI